MSSKKPIVRQAAWLSLIPHLIVMGLLMFIFYQIFSSIETAAIYAVAAYLIISLVLRSIIPHNHRKGVSLYRAGKYPQAAGEFEKSYHFFSRHSWVDKYRFITLLSSSRMSYTEMALINMAFCYAQSGNAELSKRYYDKAFELYPDSEMAKSALNMITVFEGKSDNADI